MKNLLKDYKKICFILVLFIVFAFALISCESSDTKTKGFVSGFVLDATTGEPLSGVNVSVSASGGVKDATTDEKGAYIIENILTGEYVALYKKDGYKSESGSVKADPYTDGNAPIINNSSSPSSSAVKMIPLAGSVKGTIRALTVDYKDAQINSKLKVWVRGSDTNYGPADVKADGTFTISGLPVGLSSKLSIEPFIENGYSYIDFSGGNNNSFTVIKGTVDLGILFIFPSVTDKALISAINVSEDSPIDPVDGSITITFSKPIDQDSFRVSNYGYDNAIFTGSTYSYIDLIAKWDSETKVTLTPPAGRNFKYNLKGSNSIRINGRTKDYFSIYVNNNNEIPIYTVDSIKLLDVTTDTGALPNRSISNSIAPSKSFISNATTSIKLTFNKDIDEVKSKFYWDNVLADFRFGVTGTTPNKKVVYVSTATLVQNGPIKNLTFQVVSAKDENDTTITSDYSNFDFDIQKGVEPPPPLPYMALVDTDKLYTGKPSTMTADYYMNNQSDLSRDTTGDITLTFNINIPTDATIDVTISGSGLGYPSCTWTTSGKDLKITPNGSEAEGRLSNNSTYSITVTIWAGFGTNHSGNDDKIIFSTTTHNYVNYYYLTTNPNYIYYYVYGNGIVFKTKNN